MWYEVVQSNVHTSSVVLYAAPGGVEVAIEGEKAACKDVGGGKVMWDDMSTYLVEMSEVAAASLAEPQEDDKDFFSSWNFLRAVQLLCLCPVESKNHFQHYEQSSIGGMPGRSVDDEEEKEADFLFDFFFSCFEVETRVELAEESVCWSSKICGLKSL